jgi:hypothetical protein
MQSEYLDKPNKCLKFFKDITKNLKEWIKSPYFILHFVRISMLLWIYNFQNYQSLVLLLW